MVLPGLAHHPAGVVDDDCGVPDGVSVLLIPLQDRRHNHHPVPGRQLQRRPIMTALSLSGSILHLPGTLWRPRSPQTLQTASRDASLWCRMRKASLVKYRRWNAPFLLLTLTPGFLQTNYVDSGLCRILYDASDPPVKGGDLMVNVKTEMLIDIDTCWLIGASVGSTILFWMRPILTSLTGLVSSVSASILQPVTW